MGMIIPAAIGAGAQVAGGVMGGKAQKQAAKSQLQAQREALAYQKSMQAAEDARYKQAMGIWASGRAKLAEMYGLTPEDVGVTGLLGGGAAGMPSQAGVGARPANLGEILTAKQEQSAQPALGEWSDWRQYGLRQS